MSAKKTVSKKKPAKKTTSKPKAKKPAAKKTARAVLKSNTPVYKSAGTRRPASSPNMPLQMIGNLQVAFAEIKGDLEEYAAHLRA
jgi:hypothetical protein